MCQSLCDSEFALHVHRGKRCLSAIWNILEVQCCLYILMYIRITQGSYVHVLHVTECLSCMCHGLILNCTRCFPSFLPSATVEELSLLIPKASSS